MLNCARLTLSLRHLQPWPCEKQLQVFRWWHQLPLWLDGRPTAESKQVQNVRSLGMKLTLKWDEKISTRALESLSLASLKRRNPEHAIVREWNIYGNNHQLINKCRKWNITILTAKYFPRWRCYYIRGHCLHMNRRCWGPINRPFCHSFRNTQAVMSKLINSTIKHNNWFFKFFRSEYEFAYVNITVHNETQIYSPERLIFSFGARHQIDRLNGSILQSMDPPSCFFWASCPKLQKLEILVIIHLIHSYLDKYHSTVP